MSESRSIRGYGSDRFGQCTSVVSNEKITQLRCGWTHNGYLTASDELFLWGRNCYGQLGIGTTSSNASTPHKCLIYPVADFALGAEHGILKSSDSIYTFGWNEHGNCGNGSVDDV